MVKGLIVAALTLLGGCAASMTPAQLAEAQAACQVDGVLQPVAVSVLAAASPSAATVDALLVHPAVVAYCASLGGTPVATPAAAQ